MKSPFRTIKYVPHYLDFVKRLQDMTLPPINVDITISNLCNHRCPGCSCAKSRQERPQIMAIDEMRNLIEELADFGVRTVNIEGGGEPTMGHLAMCVDKLIQVDMPFGLISNGGLFAELKATFRAVKKYASYMRFSVDAVRPETYRQMHGMDGEELKRVEEGIKEFVKMPGECIVGVSYLVGTTESSEIVDVINKVNKIGVDYVQLKPLLKKGKVLQPRFSEEWASAVRQSRVPVVVYFDPIGIREILPDTCSAGRIIGSLDPNFDVFNCCCRKDSDTLIGRMEGSFVDFWKSQNRVDRIRDIEANLNTAECIMCRATSVNEVFDEIRHPGPCADFL